MADITRDFLGVMYATGVENLSEMGSEVADQVHDFQQLVEDVQSGPAVYQARSRHGRDDGKKSERRVVWKRDPYQGLHQSFE